MSIGGRHSNTLAAIQKREKNLEHEAEKKALGIEEKGYSSELNNRGAKSFFEEYYGNENGEKIPLALQNLPQVGPFEDITQTVSFQRGRQRGEFLIQNGYTEQLYYEKFLPDFQEKYDSKKRSR